MDTLKFNLLDYAGDDPERFVHLEALRFTVEGSNVQTKRVYWSTSQCQSAVMVEPVAALIPG